MNCNCNSPASIDSFIDWQNVSPTDPLDLIAYATLDGVVGTHEFSSDIINPGVAYATNSWAISSAPTCTAWEDDNHQMTADATQWNFQHRTISPQTNLAPPLSKVIFLRGGVRWKMTFEIDIPGDTPFDNWQLTFRDNAGTRGDAQGTVPVLKFTHNTSAPTAILILTLKPIRSRATMILRADDGMGKPSCYESEWIIVP